MGMARYLTFPAEKEEIISTLEGWLAGVTEGNTATLQLIAAMVFLHEDNTKVCCGLLILRGHIGGERTPCF